MYAGPGRSVSPLGSYWHGCLALFRPRELFEMFLAGDCGVGSRLFFFLAPGGSKTPKGLALDSKRPVILSCWGISIGDIDN
jgi:hypothetical protein